MSKTVLIELHGFTSAYINPDVCPHLNELALRFGLKTLEPPFGPDAFTTLWTGVHATRHDQFFKYAYHGGSANVLRFFPRKLHSYLFNLYRLARGHTFFTQLAPRKEALRFAVHKKHHYFAPGAYPTPTFFDLIRRQGGRFLFYEHPMFATEKKKRLLFGGGSDTERGRRFISNLADLDKDFYFLMLRDVDQTGHRFGPGSHEVQSAVRVQDKIVEGILKHLNLEQDKLFVISCYGMVPVAHQIDLEALLPPTDDGYLYFLDSTFARFWFFDIEKKKRVMDVLANADCGHVLDDEERRRYHVNLHHTQFGEELFLMDYSAIIRPDFFNDRAVKGMHTYDLSNKDGHEFGILLSNVATEGIARCIDLTPTLVDVMDLDCKARFDGQSLLKHGGNQ